MLGVQVVRPQTRFEPWSRFTASTETRIANNESALDITQNIGVEGMKGVVTLGGYTAYRSTTEIVEGYSSGDTERAERGAGALFYQVSVLGAAKSRQDFNASKDAISKAQLEKLANQKGHHRVNTTPEGGKQAAKQFVEDMPMRTKPLVNKYGGKSETVGRITQNGTRIVRNPHVDKGTPQTHWNLENKPAGSNIHVVTDQRPASPPPPPIVLPVDGGDDDER